jgi:hypothetical protein
MRKRIDAVAAEGELLNGKRVLRAPMRLILNRAPAIVISTAVLLSPAIWNGFPLIFADTVALILADDRSGSRTCFPAELVVISGHSHRRVEGLSL